MYSDSIFLAAVGSTKTECVDSLLELIHNVQVRVKPLRGRNVLPFTICIPFGLKHTPHPPTLAHAELLQRLPSTAK